MEYPFSAVGTFASFSYTTLAEALGLSADHNDLFGTVVSAGAELQEVDNGGFQLVSHPHGGTPDVYSHVGDDPVGTKHGGKTAIQDAQAIREDGPGKGTSKMNEATDRVMEKDGMGPEESAKYKEAMEEARLHPEKLKTGTVEELGLNGKKIIMADGPIGGINAKEVLVDLPPGTIVHEGTYTYTVDGKEYKETFYIIDGCANPAVLAADDVPVVKEVVPPPVAVVDHCPEDGQMFDELDRGVYRIAEKVEYVCPDGSVKEVTTSFVIAGSADEAKQLGWEEARELDGYVQMFYRDKGCLHYVGCYPPDAEDALRGSSSIKRAPDPKFGTIWDAETRDKNGELVFDKNGNGKMDAGDRVLQLKKGPDGTRMIECEFKRQGFTAFSKVQ